MNAKHVALLALLSLAGSAGALSAQPPDAAPPDQVQPPDSYAPQPPDSYAPQPPPDTYAALPADDAQPYDQYAPDQGGGVDISFFYDQLSPYGDWVQSRAYGWVWLPFGIGVSWRPYALGHWVMTDYGWTWVSDEPFGWATYHYGRWVYDPDYGWEWVPGYEWGPAWVAWRNGGGYIGWAPLPPEVRFRAGFGLDFGGIDINVALGPTRFCFVQEHSFLASNVVTFVEPPARNVTIIHNTTNITNYTVVNNRVVNQGIPVQHVEQVTHQRVPRLEIAPVRSGTPPRSPQVRGSQLVVFQPPIVKRSTPPPPPPQRARAAGADLQRRHQQETQTLQEQQAQERARLQQIHQREQQSQGPAGTLPNPRRQPGAQERQQQEQGQQQQGQQQEQQQQGQQRQGQGQGQATPQRGASGYRQDLARQHQAEIQAQQQQHQREQQQLESRHRAEQQAAQRPSQPQGQGQGQGQQRRGEQQPQNKKPPEKPPEKPKHQENPPPPPPPSSPGRR
jgi:hypothetical protein